MWLLLLLAIFDHQKRQMRLRQFDPNLSKEVEEAFTICYRPPNMLARGSRATGDRTRVNINTACPRSYKAIGIWHSHPYGKCAPSSMDIQAMRQERLRNLCISVPQSGELKCYKV